jgi:hypothetical protein
MVMYEKVTNQFSKFFNQKELDRIIDDKVDNRTMLRMAQTKASRSELSNAMEIMNKLYQRVKTISILLVE